MIFDPLYIVFALPGLLLGLFAQFLLWVAYGSYSRKSAGNGMSGLQAAEKIKSSEGYPVEIMTVPGRLSDNFNPVTNKVSLSHDNVANDSVANIAVVAHEFGHVQQKFNASAIFKIRTAMVPVVNFGSSIGYVLIMIGLVLSMAGLAYAGLILFSFTTLFALITLPIEFDASRRGMNFIEKYDLIASGNRGGAKLVLSAAALTYVAGLVQSLGQLLYFLLLIQGRSRD